MKTVLDSSSVNGRIVKFVRKRNGRCKQIDSVRRKSCIISDISPITEATDAVCTQLKPCLSSYLPSPLSLHLKKKKVPKKRSLRRQPRGVVRNPKETQGNPKEVISALVLNHQGSGTRTRTENIVALKKNAKTSINAERRMTANIGDERASANKMKSRSPQRLLTSHHIVYSSLTDDLIP